jgi:C_GCAxxG_C_C family probable redox protein
MMNLSQRDILAQLGQMVRETLAISGNCAQTTFLTVQETFDLECDGILKALTPFPGIALRGDTCGAVVGSLMALGLMYGRDTDNLDDWGAYLNSLRSSIKFCRRFESEVGSTMCEAIVENEFGRKFNLANQIEAMEWMQCGALEKCGNVIDKGVHITAEIIMDDM